MKKILFLDHDGVMCMRREQGTRFTKIKRWNLENPDNAVYYTNQDQSHVPIVVRFDDFNKGKLFSTNISTYEITNC